MQGWDWSRLEMKKGGGSTNSRSSKSPWDLCTNESHKTLCTCLSCFVKSITIALRNGVEWSTSTCLLEASHTQLWEHHNRHKVTSQEFPAYSDETFIHNMWIWFTLSINFATLSLCTKQRPLLPSKQIYLLTRLKISRK